MKKAKQILAIILIIVLVALYVMTLIAAITDQSGTMNYFFACVVATIMVPVLLWAYSFVYRLIKKNHEESMMDSDEEDQK